MTKAAPTTTTTPAAPDQAPSAVAALKEAAPRQRYTIPEPATGDALLIALAAAYRDAVRIGSEFEEAATREKGAMKTYLEGTKEAHYDRRDILEQAILVVPASDLAGVMIQIEALNQLPFCPVDESRGRYEMLRDAGCWSIFRVLAKLTGRTAADGLETLVPARDDLVDDVAEHQAAVTAFFEQSGQDGRAAA